MRVESPSKARITFRALGHHNVRATHPTTLEITSEPYLTPRGNCIVAVSSTLTPSILPPSLKRVMKREGSKISVRLSSGRHADVIRAEGTNKLALSSKTSMVIRKSSYVCDRTLAIRADKGARDLSRGLVRDLIEGRIVIIEICAWPV